MNELRLHYSDVDGILARIFLPVFVGAFAVAGMWFLYSLVVHPPSTAVGTTVAGVVLVPITWLFSWLTIRVAVISCRSARGVWWLRLSIKGFEVNDRILRPRRRAWRDVDKFMLVAPSDHFGHVSTLQVGYSLGPGHRRSIARKIFANFRGRDGTRADGIVMGYWDRPFDEAVDLMNEWARRFKAL
jgi:hypothetical protein